MRAALIGVGQAGGRIAQALTDFDRSAGFGAVGGAVAVNTARQDLRPLDLPTVLVGQDRVAGDGVGADNELGTAVMESDADEVRAALDGVVTSATEGIFVVAGLGGGTGSGGAPVLVRELRRVYDVPVYALGVLPGREEGGLYQANAGRSLKTLLREADAVLVVDNDAWRRTGESLGESREAINERVAERVGLLLAAGEATAGVAESVVDSSEVINTLRGGGVAAVGYASAEAAPDAGENVNVVASAVRKSLLTGLSLPEATRAESALVVVAGEPDRVSRKGVERARKWVQEETGSQSVRGGDFPHSGDRIAAVTLLAGVARSDRLESFFERAREAAAGRPESGSGTDPASAFESDELDGLF